MGKLINVVKDRYSVIPNEIFTDRRLDYRSKGVLGTLLSLPNGWDFSVRALLNLVTPTDDEGLKMGQWKNEGDKAIRATVHKLERLGYLERCLTKDDQGRFTGHDYKINIPPIPLDVDTRYCD